MWSRLLVTVSSFAHDFWSAGQDFNGILVQAGEW